MRGSLSRHLAIFTISLPLPCQGGNWGWAGGQDYRKEQVPPLPQTSTRTASSRKGIDTVRPTLVMLRCLVVGVLQETS